MDTFEWEDGTVVERPYIEIDGVKHYLQDGTMSGGTPVSSANLNEMQSILNNNVSGGFQTKGTVLWSNQNPASNFSSQTITLNSGDYDFYEVIFRQSTSTDRAFNSGEILKGYGTILSYHTTQEHYRAINYTTDTSLFIGEGVDLPQYGSTSSNNSQCIPLYIIGYKTGLFE